MSSNLLESQTIATPKSSRGEPTWEIAGFYPRQGEWTEAEFLTLSTNRFVELNDGCVEFLPMPSYLHQAIVRILFQLMERFVTAGGLGEVLFAPLPVRLWPGQIREPDIVFLKPHRVQKLRATSVLGQPDGADLVVEVVSPGDENRNRDLVEKRENYARAGISEYWIVDPESRTIMVLALEGGVYRVHGEFGRSECATSLLLSGFAVNVGDVFAIADAKT
jgi:Uma2 family endonuclease